MPLPVLTTDRLVLRPRSRDDLDAMAAMDADPEVARFLGGVPDAVLHRAELETWIDDPDDTSGMGGWTVRPRDEPGRYLGWIILYPLDGWEGDVEIGWRFVRDAWGHGYATEAARAVMEHAFTGTGLDHVIAILDPGNDRSRRVCEKLGMTTAGMRRAYDTDCALYVMQRQA